MKDGEILGFDDYVKAFKAADPSAILPDGGMVQFSTSAPGGNRQPATHMRPQMLHSVQRSARKVDYYGY